jgi:hypothetical protein
MDNLRFPPIPKELLEVLEKRFPDVSPEITDSLDLVRFKTGQVSVVRLLRHQFTLQNQSILEK